MNEHTLSFSKANYYSLIIGMPLFFLLYGLFVFTWGIKEIATDFLAYAKNSLLGLLAIPLIIVLCIATHELIHGFTWSIFAQKGRKAIKYGVNWKSITPYTHCEEPLRKRPFALGVIMPLLILGLVPYGVSLFLGSSYLLLLSSLMIISSIGDILVLTMLANLNENVWVKDHPEKIGFVFYEHKSPAE